MPDSVRLTVLERIVARLEGVTLSGGETPTVVLQSLTRGAPELEGVPGIVVFPLKEESENFDGMQLQRVQSDVLIVYYVERDTYAEADEDVTNIQKRLQSLDTLNDDDGDQLMLYGWVSEINWGMTGWADADADDRVTGYRVTINFHVEYRHQWADPTARG